MKKFFFALSIFLTSELCAQQVTFQKYYVDSVNFFAPHYEIIQTQEHGYLAGNVRALVKTDSLGQMEWYKQYANIGLDSAEFFSIDKTSDQGYVTTGRYLIIKFDLNYSISWKRGLTNLVSVAFYTIRETKDHGFILGGNLSGNFIAVKTDSMGIVQWSKAYSSQTGSDAFWFLTITQDNGYLLCGTVPTVIDTSQNYYDIKIIKVDSLGNPQWAKHYNDFSSTSFCYHITAVSDGGYVLTGYRNQGTFLLKIDPVGNILWEKLYDPPSSDQGVWVEETSDHGLIVTGNYNLALTKLFKTDSIGNLLWAKNYTAGAKGACVKQTVDGGFAVSAQGFDNGFGGIYLIKTDSLGHTNGCMEANLSMTESNLNIASTPSAINPIGSGWEFTNCPPVGISEIQNESSEIEISPNPFRERFKVSGFGFKAQEKYEISIYDLMGERVFEKEFLPDQTNAEFHVPYLKQGIYFLNVRTNGNSSTKKVVKM